ncbi:hypothetical protein EDD16DRAFT_1106488 [Pisolithus croceorrhizus]|nr:hypothetical protein EDD16DRAFT_1106488 [Pisolithus croceorrhizus]
MRFALQARTRNLVLDHWPTHCTRQSDYSSIRSSRYKDRCSDTERHQSLQRQRMQRMRDHPWTSQLFRSKDKWTCAKPRDLMQQQSRTFSFRAGILVAMNGSWKVYFRKSRSKCATIVILLEILEFPHVSFPDTYVLPLGSCLCIALSICRLTHICCDLHG